ncbi:AMP-binding enzyme [Nocardia brasiliensis]|uniref:AMP-binding enzyme n=1 Tax=Nocardia brasiliensis TaxID=37326 RepID=UPI0024587A39|nr:hypothetical protein [Nocardia brasiliensis]
MEVEAILSQHPAVVGALVTGVDHPTLGQEVAAAVVVREGSGAAVRDLLRYCRDNLAEYKVPGRIRLIEALPLLPNGKPSRRLIAPLFRTAP